jgi:hypothetical protein
VKYCLCILQYIQFFFSSHSTYMIYDRKMIPFIFPNLFHVYYFVYFPTCRDIYKEHATIRLLLIKTSKKLLNVFFESIIANGIRSRSGNLPSTYEKIIDRISERRRPITTIIFLCKKVILNQPSPGQEKCLVSDGRSSWPFEIELPRYTPPAFEIPHV